MSNGTNTWSGVEFNGVSGVACRLACIQLNFNLKFKWKPASRQRGKFLLSCGIEMEWNEAKAIGLCVGIIHSFSFQFRYLFSCSAGHLNTNGVSGEGNEASNLIIKWIYAFAFLPAPLHKFHNFHFIQIIQFISFRSQIAGIDCSIPLQVFVPLQQSISQFQHKIDYKDTTLNILKLLINYLG